MKDKFMGCIYGSIIGDIIGSYNEFRYKNNIREITEDLLKTKRSVFGYNFGYFTDDTSMSLITMINLLKSDHKKFNFMRDWNDWISSGFMSSAYTCFDVGIQTQIAIDDYFNGVETVKLKNCDGNGAMMRIHPVALLHWNNTVKLTEKTIELNDYTHMHSKISRILCVMLNRGISEVLRGASKEEILRRLCYNPAFDENVTNSGYVVESFKCAVHTFNKFDNLMDGVYYIANKGDDSDTCAAIYGALAGAFYGKSQIPEWMLNSIRRKEEIKEIAESFYDKSISMSGESS